MSREGAAPRGVGEGEGIVAKRDCSHFNYENESLLVGLADGGDGLWRTEKRNVLRTRGGSGRDCRRATRGRTGSLLACGESDDGVSVGRGMESERMRPVARVPRAREDQSAGVRCRRRDRGRRHQQDLHARADRAPLSASVGEGREAVEGRAPHRLHGRRGEGSVLSAESRQPAAPVRMREARHHARRLSPPHPRRHDARARLRAGDEFVRPLVRDGKPRTRMGDLRQREAPCVRRARPEGQSEDAGRHPGERPRLVRAD